MHTLIDGIREHAWAWLITVGVVPGLARLVQEDPRDGRRTRVKKDDGRTRVTHDDHARTAHRSDPWQGSGPTS